MTKVVPIQVDPHFTPAFYAELWRVDQSTVVRWFQDEPGVLHLGEESKNGKRTRRELRVPWSVAMRVYGERTRHPIKNGTLTST
jgi:hypothetical protein